MNGDQTDVRRRKNTIDKIENGVSGPKDAPFESNIDNNLPAVHNYGSAAEYGEAVRAWLWAYHNWQLSQCLMPFFHQPQCQMAIPPQTAVTPADQALFVRSIVATNLETPVVNSSLPTRGVQFTIPHFGRRILAEAVDGLICFALSLLLTFIFVELGFIDSEKYEKILNYEADLSIVINITQDLFPLEIIKRIITSFIEALYLSRGASSIPSGQTPGKYLLGLKVVPCEEISFVSARDGLVSIYSVYQMISFKNAFVRSIIKNFAVGFLFPLCVVMYTFRFNRSVYDLASDTVVVEA